MSFLSKLLNNKAKEIFKDTPVKTEFIHKADSLINLDPLPFMLLQDVLAATPDDINDVVFIKRHGVIKLGDFTLNRYYFGSDDPEEQSFLEVETDPDGNTLSAKVFVLYDVVRPMTSEDWEFWTSEKDGLIGYPLFQLNNEDETAYGIEWGSADVDKTQPSIKLEEEIYSTQEPRGILKHSCMLYGRNLKEDHPGSNEYCLVSSIETPKDSYIGIYTGVKYDLTDFQIIALDEKQETRV